MVDQLTIFTSKISIPAPQNDDLTIFSDSQPYVSQPKFFEPYISQLKQRLLADTKEWFRHQLDIEFLQGWGMTETNPIGLMGRGSAPAARGQVRFERFVFSEAWHLKRQDLVINDVSC